MRPAGTIQSVRMERRAIASRRGVTNETGGLIPTQTRGVATSAVPVDPELDPPIRERGTWVPPVIEDPDPE